MPSFIGEILSVLSIGWSTGKAAMGRAVVIAQGSQGCDVLLRERDMGTYRQWVMQVSIIPRKLEFRNCNQRQYRLGVKVSRSALAGGASATHDYPGTWIDIDLKHYVRDGEVTAYLEPFPSHWVTERTSLWNIEFRVQMANQRKWLYKGHPTTLQVEREP